MDAMMIQRWNEVVKPNDHVWHLGDLYMGSSSAQAADMITLVKGLNGHKRIILGNHDDFKPKHYLEAGFEKIMSSHRHDNMILSHIPIHPGSMGRHIANIHGHTHDAPPYRPIMRQQFNDVWDGKEPVKPGISPYINICVEQTFYRPITLGEIKERVSKAIEEYKDTNDV